jgi:hypothetical protein
MDLDVNNLICVTDLVRLNHTHNLAKRATLDSLVDYG